MVKASNLVEVARSFSYKLSITNPKYESRDFFCSQKAECEEKDAVEVSKRLHAFCKREVLRDVAEYRASRKQLVSKPKPATHKVSFDTAEPPGGWQGTMGRSDLIPDDDRPF